MKNLISYISSVFILFAVLNCGRIEEKIEKKVDEKIDKKIDETINKLDSNYSKEQLDSLRMTMDSIDTKQDKRSKKVR